MDGNVYCLSSVSQVSRGIIHTCVKVNVVQEAEIMEAWLQALEDCDSKDDESVDEDIGIKDEELDVDRKRAQVTECSTQGFLIRSEIQYMIGAGM